MQKLLLAFMIAIGFAAQVSADADIDLLYQASNRNDSARDLLIMHKIIEKMRAEREQQGPLQQEEAQKWQKQISKWKLAPEKWQLEGSEKQQLEIILNRQLETIRNKQLKKVKKSILDFESRNIPNFFENKRDVFARVKTYKMNKE